MQEAFLLLTLAFAFAIAHKLYSNNVFKLSPYVVTAFAVFLLSFFIGMCRRAVFAVGCRSPPFQSGLLHFKNFRLEEKRMAYNNGRENRKWLIWKEAEEKILREWQTRRSRRRQWPLPKCLSQGYHYDGGKWTQAHFKWLKALELSGLDRETLRGVSDHIWIPDEPDREFW